VKEIKNAVFSLESDKIPGLDSFNKHFYQYFWALLCANILDIFRPSIMLT